MKKYSLLLISLIAFTACNRKDTANSLIQGKVEREEIAVVSKVPGRILKINFNEGDQVKKGDTLAILDIPEVDAKKAQAQGAVKSADAQYAMSVRGATANQLKQLDAKRNALKEQYDFAKKSLSRIQAMVSDSLVPQQQYDEVYAKYQGALAQYTAVEAEIADVKNGVRIEQQTMALGQKDRALGALQEVQTAEKERYIIAPQDMTLESITLKVGELALPGYTLFTGSLKSSTYFRFTVPESKIEQYKKGEQIEVTIPYQDNKKIEGTIRNVKQIGAYANIATAYPDYNMQDALYEITVEPKNIAEASELFSKSTVTINKK
ncbi:HlyD family secretion protein [Pedobacter montanisoli]|uniref:Efflux RND transporter periplasmic adaptor subunit n=1 Tax=Pedobacter montanisoli TaxID=2923277 RepID=A0ABT0A023_9SPHI|nr:efflux RND transporter periplasmic adaptor subunit [Pedobacter montanisoli]MCJ0743921.1 efflux RND transporter periplasmic adaptor subunit [Pedobacter montanisoli]